MVKIFKPAASKSLKGKSLKVKIERMDFNGRGVARYQKKPVFVAGALPTEVVNVRVLDQTSKYLVGQLKEVVESSEHRISPKCKHNKVCGGCDLQHLAQSQHIDMKLRKVNELFARQGIHELAWQQPIVEDMWHYRRKARLGVQYHKDGTAVVGFRENNTNQVTPIKECITLVKTLSLLIRPITELVNLLPNKSIGHIELIHSMDEGESLVTIVVRQLGNLTDETKSAWLLFTQRYSDNARIQVHFDLGGGSELVSLSKFSPLMYVVDSDIKINFEPDNFIQVHHQVNEKMISQALSWLSLTRDDNVLDLYCGLGNFSLPIAKRVTQVTGVEGVEEMVDKASRNAKSNKINNVAFFQANLNEEWKKSSWQTLSYTKILLDPARAGALEACQQLGQFGASDIVYVSCDPATLARDSAELIKQGYALKKIALMDMFSQTKHVETMVLFQRVDS